VRSDVHSADIAAGSYFLLALRAGIKIYRYGGGRILHAKTGVIDDAWGSVGSANIDNLSLLLNFEGNIKSLDRDFIAELKRQFLDDIANARLVKKEDWVRRPFWRKILEVVMWPIHSIL
jgi:cardiolipin synthase